MSDLAKLPNIGAALEKRLANAGIVSERELKSMGSRAAFLKLRLIEGDTCFNCLCGLEGAVRGVRWHALSAEDKKDLKAFFDTVNKE
jgi:DNA transformation protein